MEKRLLIKIKQIDTTSSRIIAVRAIKENIDLLLINVYKSCKNNETVNEFTDISTQKMTIYNTYKSSDIILGGDFNCDLKLNDARCGILTLCTTSGG